jgi:hypothetical protein
MPGNALCWSTHTLAQRRQAPEFRPRPVCAPCVNAVRAVPCAGWLQNIAHLLRGFGIVVEVHGLGYTFAHPCTQLCCALISSQRPCARTYEMMRVATLPTHAHAQLGSHPWPNIHARTLAHAPPIGHARRLLLHSCCAAPTHATHARLPRCFRVRSQARAWRPPPVSIAGPRAGHMAAALSMA